MTTKDTDRPGPPRTAEDWDARYRDDSIPWEIGQVHGHLVAMVRERPIVPCSVLEVGCGTGNDALWLAEMGFDVTAVDLSPTAVERARQRATEAALDISFAVGSLPDRSDAFDLVYDYGCFHVLDAEGRAAFAASAARCLRADGLWLSVQGSTDGPPREHGPPRLSAVEVATAVEPSFELLSLTHSMYEAEVPTPAHAWVMLVRKRA